MDLSEFEKRFESPRNLGLVTVSAFKGVKCDYNEMERKNSFIIFKVVEF